MKTNNQKLQCNKCSHKWDSRTPVPKCCPACKSYLWDGEKMRALKGERLTAEKILARIKSEEVQNG